MTSVAISHDRAVSALSLSDKPKVLFLSPVGFFKGGAERSLQDLLNNPHITPYLMAPEEGPILDTARSKEILSDVLDFGTINTIRRPFSFAKGLGVLTSLYTASSNLKKYCKANEIKIVHSNGLKAHMINVISRRLGGPKAIIHIRDIPYTRPEKLVWNIMHLLCDRMILVSAPCWPEKKLPRKAVVIHNGIDIAGLPKTDHSDKSSAIVILGFVGRIHPAKGLHLLIDWIAVALKKGHDLKLSVRGSFSDDAPNYKQMIMKQIADLDLEGKIEFTGQISDPKQVYKGLDIVVVPSEIPDPLPRSVMEAMAQNLIVFGYPAGGILDMIDEGYTGYLIPDDVKFCRALDQIKKDPELKKRICSNAQRKILEKFTIENLHNSVSSLYKNFL